MKTIKVDLYQKHLDMGRFDISDRKFYQSVLNSVKKQNGRATERQFDILQQIFFGKNMYSTKNEHIYNKIFTMDNTKLIQLIRESINDYIREIDEAGNVAALEAKMNKTQEAIELREKKMNMDGLDEAYHDMLDKGKMKELSSEVKALKKSLAKYEKQLDKLKNKANKSAKTEDTEEKEIVDEVSIDETFPESGPQLEELDEARFKKGTDIGKKGKGFAKIAKSAAKRYGSEEAGQKVAGAILKKVLKKESIENLNENKTIDKQFLHMQKLAGLITETQYKEKIQMLSEGIKLDVLIKDGKPNSEILVVPNKFYSDKEELDANTMRPLQIKKEEGRKDMMIFTVVGRKAENQQYPIEGDEVADVITYDEAKKKVR